MQRQPSIGSALKQGAVRERRKAMWRRVDLATEQIARPGRRQAHMFRSADRQLREIRLSCGTIARRDLPIEACGEEASLSDVCPHPKGQVQDLSCSSRCSQPVAEIDREVLVCLSTGRRDEIGAVGYRPRDHRGHGHALGVRAPEVRADDALADLAIGDALADLDDRARALVADDVRHGGHLAAGPVQRVAALDADRLDLDDDPARIHLGIRDVLVAEDVGRTGLVVDGGLHPPPARPPDGPGR